MSNNTDNSNDGSGAYEKLLEAARQHQPLAVVIGAYAGLCVAALGIVTLLYSIFPTVAPYLFPAGALVCALVALYRLHTAPLSRFPKGHLDFYGVCGLSFTLPMIAMTLLNDVDSRYADLSRRMSESNEAIVSAVNNGNTLTTRESESPHDTIRTNTLINLFLCGAAVLCWVHYLLTVNYRRWMAMLTQLSDILQSIADTSSANSDTDQSTQ